MIIIKHVVFPSYDLYSEDEHYYNNGTVNKVHEYYIELNPTLINGAPWFHKRGQSFGRYISTEFIFPSDFRIDSVSNPLTVEFYITENAVEGIDIVNGISDYMDNQVIEILQASSDGWSRRWDGQKILTAKIRCNFIFFKPKHGPLPTMEIENE